MGAEDQGKSQLMGGESSTCQGILDAYGPFLFNNSQMPTQETLAQLTSNYTTVQDQHACQVPLVGANYQSGSSQTAVEDLILNLSQGNKLTYTQMLHGMDTLGDLGIPFSQDNISLADSGMFFEPMGAENKLFMITGRSEDTYMTPELMDNTNYTYQSASTDDDENSLDKQWADQLFCSSHEGEPPGTTTKKRQDLGVDTAEQQHPLFADEGNQMVENITETSFYADGTSKHISNAEEQEGHTLHWEGPEGIAQEKNKNDNEEGQRSNDKAQAGQAEQDETGQPVELLSEEDIHIFLDNENITETITSSQEVRNSLVPRLQMLFDTDKDAYEFYNTYANICGFSTKKASNYHSRKGDNTRPTRYTLKCNRAGKIVDKEKQAEKRRDEQIKRAEKKIAQGVQPQKKRKRNLLQVTGCKAQMVISLRGGKWEVITLELEHNHELSAPDESRFLRSHKHMTKEEKLIIRTFNAVKLPTRKIMGILAAYRGGIKAVPYNKKYVSNYMTAIRKENSKNDMMQVSDYFTKRQSLDPSFYFAIKLDKSNTVESLFWADGNARRLYDAYGDCISFDTTYRTNRYNLPFAPFVGITGHGSNCLFACAILENETIETFKWLFETFLHCMSGKQPVSIITDQDVAMKQAIPQVFTQATHRNCLWHIKKKAEERCAKAFASKINLHEEFNDILNNSVTEEEFEDLWTRMIVKYAVDDIKYLQDKWLERHRFVPVYFKNVFFPFINSTARSEGTNAIFKDNVGSTYSIISFLGEYQTIAENIEEKEKELDHVTRTTNPSYIHCSEMEIEAGKAYNRPIFYKFQKQLRFTANLHVEEVQRFERYEVYKSNYYATMEFRSRRYVVAVDMKNEDFACLCCKFQKDGILCAHILRVLVHLNISRIPDKYIIQRWRPRDRKVERDRKYNVPRELTAVNNQLRYNILCRWFTEISSDAAKTNEDYLMLVEEAKRIQAKMDSNAAARASNKNSNDRSEGGGSPKATQAGDMPAQQEPGVHIKDPQVAAPKGRPRGTGRMKTIVEGIFTKQQITCSHCGGHDHNIATCAMLHLDRAQIQKQKKAKTSSGSMQDRTSLPEKGQMKKSGEKLTINMENTDVQRKGLAKTVLRERAEHILNKMNLRTSNPIEEVSKEKRNKKKKNA